MPRRGWFRRLTSCITFARFWRITEKHGEDIWERFTGKKEGTLWYYRALSDEYQRRDPNRITRELEIAVAELETLADESKGLQVRKKSAKKKRGKFGEMNNAPNA